MEALQGVAAARYELPAAIASFAGEINDADAHESLPIKRWVEAFGSGVIPLQNAILNAGNERTALVEWPDAYDDDAPIDARSVWTLKNEQAPGSFDMERRIAVMDFVGIKREVLFGGAAPNFTLALYNKADDPNVFRSITGDRKGYAAKVMDLYNDWCVRVAREHDRLRPVAMLVGETPDELHVKMKALVNRGIRLFMVPTDSPPAGVSPASPLLDPVWALAADAGCAVLGHIAISENLFKTLVWRDAPAFEGWKVGTEFSLDPWTLSNVHLQVQNYVMTMVMGGVFERHPGLIFGTAEFTGHWVGPLAENMDRWHAALPFPITRGEPVLKMKPSDYLRRNVRVACFDFEPVGAYIDRFGLEEVYCFASDFPHHEGGKDPMNNFVKHLAGKSPETFRKFFIENGRALLPD
jgi:predicted TIM-barrel fold metal-dependent hydrolase